MFVEHLQKSGHQLTEVGTDSTAPVDYPDYAEAVALGVIQGRSTLLHRFSRQGEIS
jgi:ribose 5-phosphate isomerase RpiB